MLCGAKCKRFRLPPCGKPRGPKKSGAEPYDDSAALLRACFSAISFAIAYGAAATIALTVQKSLSIAPMLIYQHSRSGVCWPGR